MIDFSKAFQDTIHQAFTAHGTVDSCAILVHGFPGTPAEMRPLAYHLLGRGWTVHAPLLPGFGAEINSLTEKSTTDWLTTILHAIERFRSDYQNLIVVGFSLGGAISIEAVARTKVDGLILLAPFWQIDHILWHALPLLQYLIPQFKPFRLFKPDFSDSETRIGITTFVPDLNLDDESVQQQIINFSIPTRLINQIRIAGQHGYQYAEQVTCPTLIIQGLQDELVRPERTQKMAKRFQSNVSYVMVECDHNLRDDTKPHWNKLLNATNDFVAQFQGIHHD